MSNQPTTQVNRYYYYDMQAKIVYHSKVFLNQEETNHTYLGESDNPIPASAATTLTKNLEENTGFRLVEL